MAPFVPFALARINMLVHEMLQLRVQCTNLIAHFKTHMLFLLPLVSLGMERLLHVFVSIRKRGASQDDEREAQINRR
jgi:hypothetical protein